MTKRNAWSRAETLELLDIIRSSCVSFLDGTVNNRKGQMYRQIEYEMQRRGTCANRDARQIEHKWKNLKFGYERYKSELEQHETHSESKPWLLNPKPCDFYKELEELFNLVEPRSTVVSNAAVETIVGLDDVTYYEEEFVTDETQELAVDDDAVVIEEIVYDSQDAIEFEEPTAGPSSSKAPPAPLPPAQTAPKRKKLTAENMDGLLLRICELQKEHNEVFNRKQMEYIENEFESFREREREHLLQLKLDLEVLKQKFLARIQKIAIGEGGSNEPAEETVGHEAKRRRVGAGASRRK
uniref:Myb/SANT-like DNA-binding domain-containing protein n=1 Tax=Anopheles christyi TaxID=43041 RepID=A0A182JTG0_9DIPT